MLDAVILEKAGIPAIPIITNAFEATAKEMAELWGVPDFRFVMMPHPLVTLTPPDIDRYVEDLIDDVLGLLQQGQPA